MSAYLSQTIIGISNKIGFCKTAAINNSIGRRVVVYRMTKKLGKLKPFQSGSHNTDVRLQYMNTMRLEVFNDPKLKKSLGDYIPTMFGNIPQSGFAGEVVTTVPSIVSMLMDITELTMDGEFYDNPVSDDDYITSPGFTTPAWTRRRSMTR